MRATTAAAAVAVMVAVVVGSHLGTGGEVTPAVERVSLRPEDFLEDLATIEGGGMVPHPRPAGDGDDEADEVEVDRDLEMLDPRVTDMSLLNAPVALPPAAALTLEDRLQREDALLAAAEDIQMPEETYVPATVIEKDMELFSDVTKRRLFDEEDASSQPIKGASGGQQLLSPSAIKPMIKTKQQLAQEEAEGGVLDRQYIDKYNPRPFNASLEESGTSESIEEGDHYDDRESLRKDNLLDDDDHIDWDRLASMGVMKLDKAQSKRLRMSGDNMTFSSAPKTDQCQVRKVSSCCFTLECSISHWISDDPDASCRMIADKRHGHPDEKNPRTFAVPYLRLKTLTDLSTSLSHEFHDLEPGAEFATGMVCETQHGEVAYMDPVTTLPYKIVLLPDQSRNLSYCKAESVSTENQEEIDSYDKESRKIPLYFANPDSLNAMVYRVLPDGRELSWKSINTNDASVFIETFPTHIWRVRTVAMKRLGGISAEQAASRMDHGPDIHDHRLLAEITACHAGGKCQSYPTPAQAFVLHDCISTTSTCARADSFTYFEGYMEVGNNVHYDPFVSVGDAKDYCCLNPQCLGITFRAERNDTLSNVKVWFKGNMSAVVPEKGKHWHSYVKNAFIDQTRTTAFRVDGTTALSGEERSAMESRCPLRTLEITGINLDEEAGGTLPFNADTNVATSTIGPTGFGGLADTQTFVLLPDIKNVVIHPTALEDNSVIEIVSDGKVIGNKLQQGQKSEKIMIGLDKVELNLFVSNRKSGYATTFPIILSRRLPNVPTDLDSEPDRPLPPGTTLKSFLAYTGGGTTLDPVKLQRKMTKYGADKQVAEGVVHAMVKDSHALPGAPLNILAFSRALNTGAIALIGEGGRKLSLPPGLVERNEDKLQRGAYAQEAMTQFEGMLKTQKKMNGLTSNGKGPKLSNVELSHGISSSGVCNNRTVGTEVMAMTLMRMIPIDWGEAMRALSSMKEAQAWNGECIDSRGFFQALDMGMLPADHSKSYTLWEATKLMRLLDKDNDNSLSAHEIRRLPSLYYDSEDVQYLMRLLLQGWGEESKPVGLGDILLATKQGILPPVSVGVHNLRRECGGLVDAVKAVETGRDLERIIDLVYHGGEHQLKDLERRPAAARAQPVSRVDDDDGNIDQQQPAYDDDDEDDGDDEKVDADDLLTKEQVDQHDADMEKRALVLEEEEGKLDSPTGDPLPTLIRASTNNNNHNNNSNNDNDDTEGDSPSLRNPRGDGLNTKTGMELNPASLAVVLEARGWSTIIAKMFVQIAVATKGMTETEPLLSESKVMRLCLSNVLPSFGLQDGFYDGEGSPLRLLEKAAAVIKTSPHNQTKTHVADIIIPFLSLQVYERLGLGVQSRTFTTSAIQTACEEQRTADAGMVVQLVRMSIMHLFTTHMGPGAQRVATKQNWCAFSTFLEAYHNMDTAKLNTLHVKEVVAPQLVRAGMLEADAATIARAVDTTGNNYIDFFEFAKAYKRGVFNPQWSKRSTALVHHHRMIFNMLNTGGGEAVSSEELQGALAGTGMSMEDIAVINHMAFMRLKGGISVDQLGNRRVTDDAANVETIELTFDHFLSNTLDGVIPANSLTTAYAPRLATTGVATGRLRRSFAQYDGDGNGHASRKEIVGYVSDVVNAPREEAAILAYAALGSKGDEKPPFGYLSLYTFTIAVAQGLLPISRGEGTIMTAAGTKAHRTQEQASAGTLAKLLSIEVTGASQDRTYFDPTGKLPYEVDLLPGISTFELIPILDARMSKKVEVLIKGEQVGSHGKSKRISVSPAKPNALYVITSAKSGYHLTAVKYVVVVHAHASTSDADADGTHPDATLDAAVAATESAAENDSYQY